MEQSELRRRMRSAREWAGLDQAELAVKLHADGWIKTAGREQISEAENGKRSLPPKVIEAIAEICGVPYEFLTDDEYDPFVGEISIVVGDDVTYTNARGHREVMTVEDAQARGLLALPEDQADSGNRGTTDEARTLSKRAKSVRPQHEGRRQRQ